MLLDSLQWILFHTPLNGEQHLYLGLLDAILWVNARSLEGVCVCLCVEGLLLGVGAVAVTLKCLMHQ